MQFLRQVGIVSLAAVRAQLGKIAALKAAQAVKEEKEEQAAELARQQARINFLKASGEDTTQLELNLKATELNTLLNAAQRNEAAIIQKQGEIDAAIEAQRVATEERKRARMLEDFENEMTLLEKQGKDTLELRIKFQKQLVELDKKDTSEAGLARLRADLQKLKEMQVELNQRMPDLGKTLLQKLFGVKPEDVQQVKEAITQAVGMIADSVGQLTSSFLDEAMQETEQALADAQQRLQDASQALSDSQSKQQDTLQQLQTAEGARRDYLLKKLQQERAETERLAAVKAKAAADEKKQTEEKNRLTKLSAELTAAAAFATNVATAASAVYAGVKAVEKGSEVGFPANIVAIAAGLAAVIAAVASAKQLASAVKMADGGIIQGGSHASGNDVPIFGGRVRVEGGEAITPVDATRHNGALLEKIRTVGRRRPLTVADFADLGRVRVAAAPSSYYADGGILSRGAGVSGGYASADALGALATKFDQQTTLLSGILGATIATAGSAASTEQHAAATAKHTDELKSKEFTASWDFEAEQGRRRVADKLDQAENYLKG